MRDFLALVGTVLLLAALVGALILRGTGVSLAYTVGWVLSTVTTAAIVLALGAILDRLDRIATCIEGKPTEAPTEEVV